MQLLKDTIVNDTFNWYLEFLEFYKYFYYQSMINFCVFIDLIFHECCRVYSSYVLYTEWCTRTGSGGVTVVDSGKHIVNLFQGFHDIFIILLFFIEKSHIFIFISAKIKQSESILILMHCIVQCDLYCTGKQAFSEGGSVRSGSVLAHYPGLTRIIHLQD